MNEQFFEIQFSTSTAEDEKNYFTGDPSPDILIDPKLVMPVGIYRVVDGEVFRVSDE